VTSPVVFPLIRGAQSTRLAKDDLDAALGATTAEDIYDGGLWQVLRDPDGNEFCIVWGSS
jgi:hypothetical protein